MMKIKRLAKKLSRKNRQLLNKAFDFLNGDSKSKIPESLQFNSVQGVLEQIKAISNKKDKLAELQRQARNYALLLKDWEKKREAQEKSLPHCIHYKDLSPSKQKEADKVFNKLLKDLSLDKFLKTHTDPVKAKLDREKILHDLLEAKKYDLRRFADIAKHYKRDFKL